MSDPPVNISRLADSFGDDFEFLNHVYTSFLVDSGERVELLKDHIAVEDVEQCGHVAHTLKGASANVGANALSTLAGELELMARSGDLSTGQAVMDAIVPEFDSVHVFLTGYLDTIRP